MYGTGVESKIESFDGRNGLKSQMNFADGVKTYYVGASDAHGVRFSIMTKKTSGP